MMRALLRKLASKVDAQAFWGFRIWEFSLLNCGRFFPWYFLLKIMVRHPITSFRGIRQYRSLVSRARGRRLAGTATLENVLESAVETNQHLLIAAGFCMKPFDYLKGRSACPAGHFNHECRLLAMGASILHDASRWPGPCSSCGIAPLAQCAAMLCADFYIMTSAIDIARDVYLPAVNNDGARSGLFFLCPYSTEPFTFGLAVSSIRGALIEFCRGDCRTHEDWTRADLGVKRDQTFVEAETWNGLLKKLKAIAIWKKNPHNVHIVKMKNVYRFKHDQRL